MSVRIDGGPAFPQSFAMAPKPDKGMTLRDYFASKAMLGEIEHQGLEGRDVSHIAAMAYEMADAMLAERERYA